MLHFTCDQCGKKLRPDNNDHYVVKVEIYMPQDPAEITEDDLDQDHMEAVSQLIQDMEENLEDPQELEPQHQQLRFDLCHQCRAKYLRDPLGKESAQKFDFSEN